MNELDGNGGGRKMLLPREIERKAGAELGMMLEG
jgi:hypothetical protein